MPTDMRNSETLPAVPQTNQRAHRLLYVIEVGLRELLIADLQAAQGPRWYRERLPGDVYKRYQEGVRFEQQQLTLGLVPHHPLYYVDFPDLQKCIARKDNWSDVFARSFEGKRHFETDLERAAAIRNKVAHNRFVSDAEVQTLEGVLETIRRGVGSKRLSDLVQTPSSALDLRGRLAALRTSLTEACIRCQATDEVTVDPTWATTLDAWWFDDVYLNVDTEAIASFAALMEAYSRRPRYRGSGHLLERWAAENDVTGAFKRADFELEKALATQGAE